MRERLRLSLAFAGLALWFAYPFISWNGSIAAHLYRCSRAPVVDGRNPCFSDYIPIVEMMAFPMTLLLAYPFGRFAFTLLAPPAGQRSSGWWLAGRGAGSAYYPILQLAAGLGFLWALIHASGYPLGLYPYHFYWGAWLAWFALGIGLSWPREEECR